MNINKQGPSNCLVVWVLATGQKVLGSKTEYGIDDCSRSESTLNGGPSLLFTNAQKVTTAPSLNQTRLTKQTIVSVINLLIYIYMLIRIYFLTFYLFSLY